MKRRRLTRSSGDSRAVQSWSSWPLFYLCALPLLVLLVVVGGAAGSAIHLMGPPNTTNRTASCSFPKPLKALQEVLLDHLRRNTSAHSTICSQPELFDIAVGCGKHANATIESWATNLCLASSWRGGVPQSRTRRRTPSSLMGTKPNTVAHTNSGTKSGGRRSPRSDEGPLEKKLKRINSLLRKTSCKPRKILMPVLEAASLTEEQQKRFSQRAHLEPCMVEVKRCGGCCSNDELLECFPVKSKNKTIPFLNLESSGRGSLSSNSDLSYAIEDLEIVFHTKCDCGCKTKHCSKNQRHDPDTCSCKCDNVRDCPDKQYFDEEECDCQCIRKRECSSGMRFHESTCRCETLDVYYTDYVLL